MWSGGKGQWQCEHKGRKGWTAAELLPKHQLPSAACTKRQVQPPHTFTGTSDRLGWPNEKGSPLSRGVSLLCWVQGWSGVGCCLFPVTAELESSITFPISGCWTRSLVLPLCSLNLIYWFKMWAIIIVANKADRMLFPSRKCLNSQEYLFVQAFCSSCIGVPAALGNFQAQWGLPNNVKIIVTVVTISKK